MLKITTILATVALVAACAQSPDAIAPVSMGNAFQQVPCATSQTMLSAERQNLSALSSKQKSAVTGDAVGVFLIGVPVSSLTGNDVSGAIGASKGKIIALEARLLTC